MSMVSSNGSSAAAGGRADRVRVQDLEEIRGRTQTWIAHYNEVLPHDVLGDLTPVEYCVLPHPETSGNGWR
jgi:hypothetical protein